MAEEHVKRGFICATAGALSWGMSGTCGQYLFTYYTIDALLLTNMRMIGAGVVLLALVLGLQRPTLVHVLHSPRDMLHIVIFAVFGLITCQATYLSAIEYANAGTATVLQSLNVVLMSTIAAIHLRRLPNAWHMLAILLALGGVFLIATGGDFHHLIISPLALVFGFGSAACSVLYTILPSAQIRKWGTLPVNALAMLIGGMALGLIITPWRASLNLDFSGWMAIAFIVLIGTVASFTLFLRGVGDIGPVTATFIGTLEPLSATVCSFLLLGTPFTATDITGFACILATVYLVTMKTA
mgnify:FL=1